MADNYMFLLQNEDAETFAKIKAAYEKRAKAKIKNIELLRIAINLMVRKEGVE